ncbi:MAG TPA: organomercurial lyase [Candidatus Limnocylindria bacterium]|nr:organomercurial lyase [Candidatus Limnocylindria bacterium]
MENAAFDARVREAIARAIKRRGAVPTIAETAGHLGSDEPTVKASFDRMIAGHVFVAERGSSEIHSYNPFCAVRTDFRVRADGREWWAMCGWDALGIPAALGTTGTVETTCADCGARIVVDVDRDGTPSSERGTVLHVGVRAVDFWKDIYHT